MKKKKLIISIAAVAVVAALVGARFLKPKEEVNSAAVPAVLAEKPQIGSIENYTDLSGSIEPSEMASIIPKAGGEVTEVYIKSGDMVTEGQPICHIDTKMVDTAKNSMDTASVNMDNANKELERSRVLFESGNLSQQAFEQIQNSARMAQLQYDSAKIAYQNQVEFSSITAPISGKVESVSVQVHDNVGTQNIICVISGEGAKQVNFSVTERVVSELHVGDSVTINKNGTDYEGTISEVSTKIDDATGLFNIKASLANADALATGSRVKITVVSERADQVLTIPTDAVYYSQNKPKVYTYNSGTVHEVPIEVGIFDSEQTEVVSGLTEDDMVITTWSSELYEGAQVQLASENASGNEEAQTEESEEEQPQTEQAEE